MSLLLSTGVAPRDFNTYGSRRGNDAIMVRGTFAYMRLFNKFMGKVGPKTIHLDSGETMDVFDAAKKYCSQGRHLIILAGKHYGAGASRDWAAKGPFLLGVRAIIAESYERIHRSNLVGMGIVPLQFLDGQTAKSLGLTGMEEYDINIPKALDPKQIIEVKVDGGTKTFKAVARFDTDLELAYYKHGGILNFMIRNMID